jgi:hypothetical protein
LKKSAKIFLKSVLRSYLFQIDLTLEGYLFLQGQIKTDERLVWFTFDDIQKCQTADGKMPYVKALIDDFSGI